MSSSESEEEYTEENVVLETPEPVKKKRAPRKLTEVQKAKALENLRKGREKANALKRGETPVKEEKPKATKPKAKPKPVLVEEEEEETTIIQQPKKKKKQRKIILQTESDSDSDDGAIVIKTKGRKKKPIKEEPIKEEPIKEAPIQKPKLVRQPIQVPQETPFQIQQRRKMELIQKNAEMMMTQWN